MDLSQLIRKVLKEQRGLKKFIKGFTKGTKSFRIDFAKCILFS